jgi:myo-inositol-1(or 4)-monophosphatase
VARAELELAVVLAKEAGAIARRDFRIAKLLPPKRGEEMLTEIDVALNRLIAERIAQEFPDDAIHSEEEGDHAGKSARTWLVDPIDGTINFARGVLWFSISIGLADAEGMLVGVVYDPVHDEMFHADRGGGAARNGERISVSTISSLEKALVAYDYTGNPDHRNIYPLLLPLIEAVDFVPMIGSVVLEACYVAAGHFDSFIFNGDRPYDAAAASLIVQEAGGVATDLDGNPLQLPKRSPGLLVGNPTLHTLMLTRLRPS